MPFALQTPLLTPESASAAERARTLRQPVWLIGGPGAGGYAVARALHRDGDPSGFISVRQILATASEIEGRMIATLEADPVLDRVSLYVERIDRQPLAVQERVLRWADEGAPWQGRPISVRVLGQSDDGFRPADLLPSLRYRLSPLAITLPPLSTRPNEIPVIALALADEISEDLGLPEPVIDDQALQRLAERKWPGNLEELAAVISHGLIAAAGERIEDFAAAGPPRRRSSRRGAAASALRPAARSSEPESTAPDPRGLEVVLTELAHELKNPMVTIKTFGDHVEELMADPGLREKFVGLTREAIGRMDGFLEELLQFSRFSAPRRQSLPLRQAVSQAVDQNAAAIRERVRVNGLAPSLRVHVDEEQIVFALKALIRGLTRELPSESSIRVEAAKNGELTFSAPAGAAQKLEAVLDHDADGEGLRSLDYIMAEALVRRNGGTSRVVRHGDALEVHVRFPTSERGANA